MTQGLPPWYAVRTRSNFEKIVSAELSVRGYEPYLPLYQKRSLRSSTGMHELPLFPGYVFCRIDLNCRLSSLTGPGVLTTPGVVGILGFTNSYVPIPENEIEAVRRVTMSGTASFPWPYLRTGDRVRINHGALDGVEGILVQSKNDLRVVLSVELLQRSVAIEIEREFIEPVCRIQ